MALHVSAASSSHPLTPGEQWHATEIGKESVTPASYSCWENSTRYLLCGTLISENCVVPRMECSRIQTCCRFCLATNSAMRKKKDSGFLSVICVVICSPCTNESDYVELNEPVMQLLVSLNCFKQADRSLQLTQDVKQYLLLVQLLHYLFSTRWLLLSV